MRRKRKNSIGGPSWKSIIYGDWPEKYIGNCVAEVLDYAGKNCEKTIAVLAEIGFIFADTHIICILQQKGIFAGHALVWEYR